MQLLKKLISLNLANAGSTQNVPEGAVAIPKGKGLVGLMLEIAIIFNNPSGGSLSLAAADKLLVLDIFRLDFFCGIDPHRRNPFKSMNLKDVRALLTKYLSGDEVENWSDSTVGLGKSIGAGADFTATIRIPVYWGGHWAIPEFRALWGMGRTQASTIKLDISRGANPTFSNALVVKSGSAITVEVLPMVVSQKGDRWTPMPHYLPAETPDYGYTFPGGLHLAAGDRNAVHSSSSLTKMSASLDDEELFRDLSKEQAISAYNGVPNVPADAVFNDVYTQYHALHPGLPASKIQTGALRLEQPAKDLATFKPFTLYVPPMTQEEVEAVTKFASTKRAKSIKAVAVSAVEGLAVPSRLLGAMPMQLTDADDAEFHRFAGIATPHNGQPQLFIPPLVAQQAKALRASSGGERAFEDGVLRQVAASVPGAAGPRGLKATGSVVAAVTKNVG